jgi:hypothetical protein
MAEMSIMSDPVSYVMKIKIVIYLANICDREVQTSGGAKGMPDMHWHTLQHRQLEYILHIYVQLYKNLWPCLSGL